VAARFELTTVQSKSKSRPRGIRSRWRCGQEPGGSVPVTGRGVRRMMMKMMMEMMIIMMMVI
jgi:hypothetical protein